MENPDYLKKIVLSEVAYGDVVKVGVERGVVMRVYVLKCFGKMTFAVMAPMNSSLWGDRIVLVDDLAIGGSLLIDSEITHKKVPGEIVELEHKAVGSLNRYALSPVRDLISVFNARLKRLI